MGQTGKLFAFLRRHRHELFDEAFQQELEGMYRTTGAGKEPVSPGLMAMATLLQGYLGASDATMVELTVFDLRVQMVLDCLGNTEPAFSQGTLSEFRQRLIRTQMDRRLLERTVEVATRQRQFDWRKVKLALKVGIDSRPLEGAGRVEDTLNLLGHAGRKVVRSAGRVLGWPQQKVCREAGIPLLLKSSVKRALDVDWNQPEQKKQTLQTLCQQLDSLVAWVNKHLPAQRLHPILAEPLKVLEQLRNQDLEPAPSGGGGVRIRQGVAPDRRVSVEDAEMRHGRKSQSKRFNGFKQHIAAELELELILACSVTPANRPEQEATPALQKDLEQQGVKLKQLYVDRGYIASRMVNEVQHQGGEVLCKPWAASNGELFSKSAFHLDMRSRRLTCPAGQTMPFTLGTVVEFAAQQCARCPLRAQCTTAEPSRGRTVSIAEGEALQHRLRNLVKTPSGRERLRKRVGVEHRLAHLARRQGPRARYRGVRKNTFDLRRAASIQNIESWQRHSQRPLLKAG
jgi:IS5 family transposase